MKNKRVYFSIAIAILLCIITIVSVSANDVCDDYGHRWVNGNCTECGLACSHQNWDGYYCRDCGIYDGPSETTEAPITPPVEEPDGPSETTESPITPPVVEPDDFEEETGSEEICFHTNTSVTYESLTSYSHTVITKCNYCGYVSLDTQGCSAHGITKTFATPVSSTTHNEEIRCECGNLREIRKNVSCYFVVDGNKCVCGHVCDHSSGFNAFISPVDDIYHKLSYNCKVCGSLHTTYTLLHPYLNGSCAECSRSITNYSFDFVNCLNFVKGETQANSRPISSKNASVLIDCNISARSDGTVELCCWTFLHWGVNYYNIQVYDEEGELCASYRTDNTYDNFTYTLYNLRSDHKSTVENDFGITPYGSFERNGLFLFTFDFSKFSGKTLNISVSAMPHAGNNEISVLKANGISIPMNVEVNDPCDHNGTDKDTIVTPLEPGKHDVRFLCLECEEYAEEFLNYDCIYENGYCIWCNRNSDGLEKPEVETETETETDPSDNSSPKVDITLDDIDLDFISLLFPAIIILVIIAAVLPGKSKKKRRR